MRKLQTLHERGDTIVEVLIAIGVISMVLGGAYVTTQKNMASARDAEERGNAIKLVESQLEQLKNFAAKDPTIIFDSAPPEFCIVNNKVEDDSSDKCRVNSGGVQSAVQPVYQLTITKGVDGKTFSAGATWSRVNSGSPSKVEMKYRLHE